MSPEIATSINRHVPFSLSRIIMSGLFWGSFCQFVLVDSTVRLPCLLDLFLLILAHVHTSVLCPIVPLFLCICWSVVAHTHYHVFLCIVLLPVLGMLILCGLLSRQIVGTVCTCYLSLCSIFLSHNILFVSPGLVLLLFHFQFLL